jgi:hypothetical protein
VRLGQYQSAGCPISSCGTTTLNIGEVQMFDMYSTFDYINATSTTATADSSLAGQGPELAHDDDPLAWFGSASSGASASLELDLGGNGPYYEDLANVSVYNRWVLAERSQCCVATLAAVEDCAAHWRWTLALCRQDSCQDMLACFGLELYSEQNALLEAQRFDGPNKTVYVLFFYMPP